MAFLGLGDRSSFLLWIAFYIESCRAKYAAGVLDTGANWHFIERFCFLSNVGRLYYELKYPESYAVQNLYLYYDTSDQWHSVYGTSKTCAEKEAVLLYDNRQIVNLSSWTVDQYNYPGCHNISGWILCTSFREFSYVF